MAEKRNMVSDLTNSQKLTWKEVWKEFLVLIDFTWFMFILGLLYFTMFPISLAFVGPLGTVYLDAVGLGNTVYNVFGLLVFNGIMTGLDTVMAQSFGSTNKTMVGIYFQRAMIMFHLVIAICIGILVNSESLLVKLGQNREVARLSGIYVVLLAVGLPFYSIWAMLTRFFRLQNIIWLSIISTAIMMAVNLSLHYLFVTLWQFGVEGSAYAQIATYISGFASMMALSPFQTEALERTWAGFSSQAWQDWGPLSKLSFAGLFIVCLQWWGLEICTLLSGTLGQVELAAQAILFQVNYFIYLVPISLGLTCNILIGQHVGANRPLLGKLNMQLGWVITWIASAVAIIILLSLRNIIPAVFSSEPEVISLTSETVPYLALYHVFDSTVSSSLGMVRGIAKQKMGAVVSFIGIYIIGLPIAVYLTFYADFGLKGLWIGPALGLAVETIILLFLLSRTDWQRECDMAQIRAGVDKNENEIEGVELNDETTELLPGNKRRSYQPNPAFKSKHVTVPRNDKKLSKSQLLIRRGVAISISVIIFLAGVVLSFAWTPEYPLILLTNSTILNGSMVANESYHGHG